MRKTPFPENTVAAAVMEKRGEQEAWQDIALRKDRKQEKFFDAKVFSCGPGCGIIFKTD